MWITKVSPTAAAGSPLEAWSIPELSIATWPRGSRTTSKIVCGSAAIVRWTSIRSFAMAASCPSRRGRRPGCPVRSGRMDRWKVLVTGATGGVGLPIARALANEHEVFGLARCRAAEDRATLAAAGIRPIAADLATLDADERPVGPPRGPAPEERPTVEEAGLRPIAADLATLDVDELPDGLTHVFHAGAALHGEARRDWQRTFPVNAQGTGPILA